MKVAALVQNGALKTHFDFLIFCPACKCGHGLRVDRPDPPTWTFNGNMEFPTFSPSLLIKTGPDGNFVCHSQITDGWIQYYQDSTHALAGQRVELPDI